MRRFGKILGRFLLVLVILVAILLAPVAYNETACQGRQVDSSYASLLPPEHHRAESSTLLTYPEWHIVHAYDDYARVIATGDPHDFGYFSAISGFWSSLCALSETAGAHGGFPTETKVMIYTIGVSFTAELAAKAAYEKTIGRLATLIRGKDRASLDDLSAEQAAAYARFLQQVPWYRWDFRADRAALQGQGFRNWERRIALGGEYSVKAAYAGVIAKAVASTGYDELTLRMIVTGLSDDQITRHEGARVIAQRPEGTEVETPRYRVLTHILAKMAADGADFVEIAGNDDIMFTVTGPAPEPDALHNFARQGYADTRSLVLLPVSDLADRLRALGSGPNTLEHIHDY